MAVPPGTETARTSNLQSARQRGAGQPTVVLWGFVGRARVVSRYLLLAAVYLLYWGAVGHAQDREPVAPIPATAPALEPPSPRWFVTGEEVELVDLLDACAAGLDLALDYDRSQVQGKVTIKSDLGFSDEGMWSLANRRW